MKDHISVCVCTFQRERMLSRLLSSLKLQATEDLFDYSVVVVDNDAKGSAFNTVSLIKTEFPLKITYDIEPEQSIPAARNRSIRLATGNYIAIIDDDELPSQTWLINLYKAIQLFAVDGALGPIVPFFEQPPPTWLLKGKFCERPIIKTGTILKWDQTRTGNVLIKKEVFNKSGLMFDLKWKTSGSDRAFFKQAIQAGFRFVAVEEAPVYELVPPERWAKKYYIKRALVHGYNSFRNIKSDKEGFKQLFFLVKSLIAITIYFLALPISLFLGTHILVKCLEKGAHHLSGLFAMVGIELVKKRDF